MFRNVVEVGGHCSASSFLYRSPRSEDSSPWKPLCGAIGVGALWKSPRNILVAAKAPLSSPSTSYHCLGASLLQALFSGFQASASGMFDL